MTGGHGAVPYFTAFMNPFMKDKPKDKFYETPAMPSEIKAMAEQRKREEQEKLEKADEAGRSLGVSFNTGTKSRKVSATDLPDTENAPASTDSNDTPKPEIDIKPAVPPKSEEPPKSVKPEPPAKKSEPAEKPKPEGAKRKGKKGDGDN